MATPPSGMGPMNTLQLAKLAREKCSPIPADKNERIMAEIERILSQPRSRSDSPKALLEQMTTIMYRHLDFSEIVVAIKDPVDGLFKYQIFVGMRKEAETAYRKLAYSADEATNESEYPRVKCTPVVDFFPAELRPNKENEVETFNRPGLLTKARTTLDMLSEGDYFCAYMRGQRNELYGWLELARTKDGKFPSSNTLKWVNLICVMLGKILG